MKPVVTVISCFYNAEKYIESYLNEISKQSFDNFEVVLINDGSTDQSDLLVKQLLPKYPFVKYFCQSNKGLGPARNFGLKHALGKYIYYLDIDDRIRCDALAKLVDIAETQKVDVVTFNSINTDETFEKEQWSPYKTRKIKEGIYEGEHFVNRALTKKDFFVPVWLYFYRHEFIDQVDFKFPAIVHEDCIYTIHHLIKATNVYFLQEILHERRIVATSIMHKKISEKRINGALEVLYDADKIYNAYKKTSIGIGIENWCYLCSTLAVSTVEDSDFRKKYRVLLVKYFMSRVYMLDLKCFIRLILLFMR